MAEQSPKRHDGRFGDTFDAEISLKAAIWSGVAILVACALGFVITLWIWRVDLGAVPTRDASPLPEASLRIAPDGPLLQADPEVELAEMRAEMATELSTWAWVDEDRGLAQLPIDVAMDLVIERGTLDVPKVPGGEVESAMEAEDAEPTAEEGSS